MQNVLLKLLILFLYILIKKCKSWGGVLWKSKITVSSRNSKLPHQQPPQEQNVSSPRAKSSKWLPPQPLAIAKCEQSSNETLKMTSSATPDEGNMWAVLAREAQNCLIYLQKFFFCPPCPFLKLGQGGRLNKVPWLGWQSRLGCAALGAGGGWTRCRGEASSR